MGLRTKISFPSGSNCPADATCPASTSSPTARQVLPRQLPAHPSLAHPGPARLLLRPILMRQQTVLPPPSSLLPSPSLLLSPSPRLLAGAFFAHLPSSPS